ncbi:MAG TPA: SRPBCC family protein [Arthrobacter sp.]|nr:SRPBCC family protein [Arthrobacter sp.]
MSNALKLTVPEGLPFIDFEREFDFPVAEVFRAHKEPELIAQWLGPRGTQVRIDHYDFRTGGSYLYRHTGPDGNSYAFSGVFHTVRTNEFAIQTFEFDGYPDVVSIEFLTFEDVGGGRSRLRGHAVYPSMEARNGMAQSGMEGGMSEGYERPEELLGQALSSGDDSNKASA